MGARDHSYEYFFDNATFGNTYLAGPVQCAGASRVVVTIENVENVDGVSVTPEVQFNTRENGFGTWSTGTGEFSLWPTDISAGAAITGYNFALATITATAARHLSVPVLGPLVRVALPCTGAAGNNDIWVTILLA